MYSTFNPGVHADHQKNFRSWLNHKLKKSHYYKVFGYNTYLTFNV